MTEERLNLSDLKAKSPADLLAMAEEWEIENASTMRKGEMMFSILKDEWPAVRAGLDARLAAFAG